MAYLIAFAINYYLVINNLMNIIIIVTPNYKAFRICKVIEIGFVEFINIL